MQVPVEQVSFSFGVMQWIFTVAIGVYTWNIGRQSASAKELLELRVRITQLETEMKQVPSQTAVHELLARLERLDAEVQSVGRRLEPLMSSLDRINDYLLNHK